MDATVVAAMITSGAKVSTWLFDKWSGQKVADKTEGFIEEHYDRLRGLTSDNCMRILKRMEDGQNRRASELLEYLYPDHNTLSHKGKDSLQSEFQYRLFFMTLAGLLIRPTSEFYITEVGKAFVNKARERKDYFKVFFD